MPTLVPGSTRAQVRDALKARKPYSAARGALPMAALAQPRRGTGQAHSVMQPSPQLSGCGSIAVSSTRPHARSTSPLRSFQTAAPLRQRLDLDPGHRPRPLRSDQAAAPLRLPAHPPSDDLGEALRSDQAAAPLRHVSRQAARGRRARSPQPLEGCGSIAAAATPPCSPASTAEFSRPSRAGAIAIRPAMRCSWSFSPRSPVHRGRVPLRLDEPPRDHHGPHEVSGAFRLRLHCGIVR